MNNNFNILLKKEVNLMQYTPVIFFFLNGRKVHLPDLSKS